VPSRRPSMPYTPIGGLLDLFPRALVSGVHAHGVCILHLPDGRAGKHRVSGRSAAAG
jgi:hypothetical protein